MAIIRSPFNWVGSKYNYIRFINTLLIGKEYESVHDIFMGSGNIILNVSNKISKKFHGNDKSKITPFAFNYIKNMDVRFKEKEIRDVILKWDNFKDGKYYELKDAWNKSYMELTEENITKEFVISTVLLFKMCRGSVLRFNNKGEFTQGFRGTKRDDGFFTRQNIQDITSSLNSTKRIIDKKDIKFTSKNFENLDLQSDKYNKSLLIIDPPYVSRDGMYEDKFSEEQENYLYSVVEKTESKFMYFNYLEYKGELNHKLDRVIKAREDLKIYSISSKSGLKSDIKLKEVLVTNI